MDVKRYSSGICEETLECQYPIAGQLFFPSHEEVHFIFQQVKGITSGLRYLHTKNIAHADLKAVSMHTYDFEIHHPDFINPVEYTYVGVRNPSHHRLRYLYPSELFRITG